MWLGVVQERPCMGWDALVVGRGISIGHVTSIGHGGGVHVQAWLGGPHGNLCMSICIASLCLVQAVGFRCL